VLLLSVTISRSLGSDLLLLLPPDMLALSAPGAIATYIARAQPGLSVRAWPPRSFVTPSISYTKYGCIYVICCQVDIQNTAVFM
jgi:hypothetical protein